MDQGMLDVEVVWIMEDSDWLVSELGSAFICCCFVF